MALVKYIPLRELRGMQEQMNRLMNISWNQALAGEELKDGIWQPAVDIYETVDSIVIKAEVPDVDQKDIEVLIEDNILILKGDRRQDDDVKKENYYRIERYFGSFQRSFNLPTTIKQDNVNAVCERGVLTITLAKKKEKESMPRQIRVKVK
jgi:HSP20 family protein